jgi:hypothetical protein
MARTNSPAGSAANDEAIRAYWASRGISTRALNALVRQRVKSEDDLRDMADDEILSIPKVGKGVLLELRSLVGSDAGDTTSAAGNSGEDKDIPLLDLFAERARTDGRFAMAYAIMCLAKTQE